MQRNEIYRIWAIRSLYATAVEQEADRIRGLALPLTEGIHKLLQGCGALDLEEDLIVVVGNFDVEMFADRGNFRFLGRAGTSVLIGSRHLSWSEVVFSEIVCVRLSRS